MTPQSFGKIAVPTPGTAGALVSSPTQCSKIRVEVPTTNTGTVWFGIRTVVGSTLTGVIKTLTHGLTPGDSYELTSYSDSDILHAEQYGIDAASANDGALVTIWS